MFFAASWVTQFRNPHHYMADFQAEAGLYRKSAALVGYLGHIWQCNPKLSLMFCLEAVYIDMYNHAILEKGDKDLFKPGCMTFRTSATLFRPGNPIFEILIGSNATLKQAGGPGRYEQLELLSWAH